MRNPLIETLLTTEGVEFDYVPGMSTDQIDRTKSGQNQSRQDPILKENVAAMRQSIRAGVDFPALVAYEDKPGVFVLIDGNNRLAALDAEKVNTTDVYRVRTDDPTQRIALTYQINPLNGVNTPPDQVALQAVNLLAHGFTARQVAEKLRTSPAFVAEARVDAQGHDRARRLGVINAWGKINARQTRVVIQRYVNLDSVFIAMVRFVAAFDVTYKDARAVVDATIKNASEHDQLDHIANTIKEIKRARVVAADPTKKRRTQNNAMSPVHLFKAHIVAMANVETSLFQGLDAQQRDDLHETVMEGLNRLTAIERALTQAEVA